MFGLCLFVSFVEMPVGGCADRGGHLHGRVPGADDLRVPDQVRLYDLRRHPVRVRDRATHLRHRGHVHPGQDGENGVRLAGRPALLLLPGL